MLGNALCSQALNLLIPFSSISVFHKIKFTAGTSDLKESEVLDSIQAWPEQWDACKWIILACFDTALIRTQNAMQSESIKCKSFCFSLDLTGMQVTGLLKSALCSISQAVLFMPCALH